MTSLWDEVPDILLDAEPRPAVFTAPPRSRPPFPDPAPESTAAMWAKWADDIRRMREVPDADSDEYDVVITEAASEFDDPISPLASYIKLAHTNGWTIVRIMHAFAFAKGKPFKTGAKAGTVRPDEEIETQWLHAEKAGVGRVAVYYTIKNGTPRGNLTTRRMNGRVVNDKELREGIKR